MWGLIIPARFLREIICQIEKEYPSESGGFLWCRRRYGLLYCEKVVPLKNLSDKPSKLFVTRIFESDGSEKNRVFYHSHTSPDSPSGMTKIDKRRITESYAMVIYVPDGEVQRLRVFRKTFLGWREFKIFLDDPSDGVLGENKIKDVRQRILKQANRSSNATCKTA